MAETAREDELLLVARSQRGDVDAFNTLVLRYQQTVFTVVMRMLGDRDIAADVTQETFLAAFRAMPNFRGGSSFRAWLMRIASNQSCDHWRRTHRHPVDSLDDLTDEDEPASAAVMSSLIETAQDVNPEEALLTQELQQIIQPRPRLARCARVSRVAERDCAPTYFNTGNYYRAIIVYSLIENKILLPTMEH